VWQRVFVGSNDGTLYELISRREESVGVRAGPRSRPRCGRTSALVIVRRTVCSIDSDPETRMRIAYLTAGAGHMYCGSCLRDNTLAMGLRAPPRHPTHPRVTRLTRTDEPNASHDE